MLRNSRHSFLTVAFGMLMASQVNGQNPPSLPATHSSFDVATIRPSSDRTGQAGWMGVRTTGGTLEARSMSLKSLVWFAYANGGPQKQMVADGGGWIDSQQWDIMAKVDDPSFAELSTRSGRIACVPCCRRCWKSGSTSNCTPRCAQPLYML